MKKVHLPLFTHELKRIKSADVDTQSFINDCLEKVMPSSRISGLPEVKHGSCKGATYHSIELTPEQNAYIDRARRDVTANKFLRQICLLFIDTLPEIELKKPAAEAPEQAEPEEEQSAINWELLSSNQDDYESRVDQAVDCFKSLEKVADMFNVKTHDVIERLSA